MKWSIYGIFIIGTYFMFYGLVKNNIDYGWGGFFIAAIAFCIFMGIEAHE
jgi:hypothetical protein